MKFLNHLKNKDPVTDKRMKPKKISFKYSYD